MTIEIKITGLKEIERKLNAIPGQLRRVQDELSGAAARIVLADRGGGKPLYPPTTEHNQPPAPYYERGVGEHWLTYTDYTSERMHEKFITETRGWATHIRNTASYSPDVIGDTQMPLMKQIGWRKLIDVAREKVPEITKAWNRIVNKAIKQAGLKVK